MITTSPAAGPLQAAQASHPEGCTPLGALVLTSLWPPGWVCLLAVSLGPLFVPSTVRLLHGSLRSHSRSFPSVLLRPQCKCLGCPKALHC